MRQLGHYRGTADKWPGERPAYLWVHGLAIVVAAAAAGLLMNCGFAYAADLPLAPGYQAPVVPPVPVYTWTGIYFGVNGGYGFGQQTPGSLFGGDFSAFNYNANGWLGGLTAGAQLQNGHTLLGLEADIDWAHINGSSSGTVSFNGSPMELPRYLRRFHQSVRLEHVLDMH